MFLKMYSDVCDMLNSPITLWMELTASKELMQLDTVDNVHNEQG